MSREPVTPETLTQLAKERLNGATVLAARPCRGGQANEVLRLELSGSVKSVILKLYSPDYSWKFDKELHLYRLLKNSGLPIASVIHAHRSEEPFGKKFLLLSELTGQPLSEVANTLPDSDLRKLFFQAGRLLKQLHQLHFESFGYITTKIVDPVSSNREYMTSRFDHRLAQMQSAEPDVVVGIRKIVARAPFDQCVQPVLCHSDFHEGNLIVARSPRGWNLTGLVDFENMIAGDPILDLAKTACYTPKKRDIKLAALLAGYGDIEGAWRDRFDAYEIFHDVELWSFLSKIGVAEPLPRIMSGLKMKLSRAIQPK